MISTEGDMHSLSLTNLSNTLASLSLYLSLSLSLSLSLVLSLSFSLSRSLSPTTHGAGAAGKESCRFEPQMSARAGAAGAASAAACSSEPPFAERQWPPELVSTPLFVFPPYFLSFIL